MASDEAVNVDNIVITIVGLLVMFSIGYVVGQNATDSASNAEETTHHEVGTHDEAIDHSHSDTFMVAADLAPTLDIEVTEDAKSGWNIRLVTTNFEFTPENVNGGNVLAQGHAHLYVNGEKIARLYGPNYHYDVNFDGSQEFRVTLNANDHSEYTVNGDVIDTTLSVNHAH